MLAGTCDQMDKPKRITLLCMLLVGSLLILSVKQFVLGSESSTFALPNAGTVNYSTIGLSWLHTSGTHIYDAGGNQVKLWGVVFQTGDQTTYTQADMQKIKDWGFSTIRLWIYWGQVEPTGPAVTNTANFDSSPWQIDKMVQWAKNVGLYVILCPGVSSTWTKPSWVPDGDISAPDGGGSWSLTDDATLTGVANLYAFMANRYASYSNVIFEGLNEMSGTDYTNFRTWNNNWVSAIEANEGSTSHLKIIQFLANYNGGTMQTYLNAYPPYVSGSHSNIVLATHDYFLVKDENRDSEAAQIKTIIQAANLPWVDTEFSTAVGGTYSGVQGAAAAMVANDISGWGYFCYNAPNGNNYNSNWAINNPNNQATILSILQPYMVQP